MMKLHIRETIGEGIGNMRKFRIDVYAAWNKDMLISRNYSWFATEEEAYEYGKSIAGKNIVDVMEVK